MKIVHEVHKRTYKNECKKDKIGIKISLHTIER